MSSIDIRSLRSQIGQAVASEIDKSGISKNDGKLDEKECKFFAQQMKNLHDNQMISDRDYKRSLGLDLKKDSTKMKESNEQLKETNEDLIELLSLLEHSDKAYTFEDKYKEEVPEISSTDVFLETAKGAGSGLWNGIMEVAQLFPSLFNDESNKPTKNTIIAHVAEVAAVFFSETIAAIFGVTYAVNGVLEGTSEGIDAYKHMKNKQEMNEIKKEYLDNKKQAFHEIQDFVQEAIKEYKANETK